MKGILLWMGIENHLSISFFLLDDTTVISAGEKARVPGMASYSYHITVRIMPTIGALVSLLPLPPTLIYRTVMYSTNLRRWRIGHWHSIQIARACAIVVDPYSVELGVPRLEMQVQQRHSLYLLLAYSSPSSLYLFGYSTDVRGQQKTIRRELVGGLTETKGQSQMFTLWKTF